ncbi:tail tube protein [Rhodomicrobium udaipurense JA643]|uniref:Phage major tail tube protein n=1 Tax=Rhodomicrobium udaipurense TaxID=1202716 RepID=A0A8I1GA06_9HYPH|nr:phage major tail tube protein [Rhodomicrobium udaipurense]KAI94097.1 tail tube protein [Rhodomicrobium udaipurense JA643]MBJ7543272.1 phage major tail tube protein [Rhodomicrobium udaipurense]
MVLPLYVIEAVDVRRADETDTSRAITISKLGLPALKRLSAEHKPGGGVGGIEFVFPQIEKIEPKFEVKGIDLDALTRFGFANGVYDKWTFAGAWRDKRTGKALPARATITGIISDWESDEFSPGELVGCNHTLKEVSHYEFTLDGKEIFYWDFYEREARSGGVSWMSDVRSALGG